MAQVDFTVTTAQYDAMMVVLDGIRAKLAANKAILSRILSQADGQAKVKAFAQTADGRWLREVKAARDDLNTFLADVGWID